MQGANAPEEESGLDLNMSVVLGAVKFPRSYAKAITWHANADSSRVLIE